MKLDSHLPPTLGFCAFSGTGKTTLLTKLIPQLKQRGLKLAIIKHAHHDFDVDHEQKDSYKLRHAGATQMLISSARRWALMTELNENEEELGLQQLLERIDHQNTDLILVEGFKRESFPKIELHRPSLGHPLLCTTDSNVIAVAVDDSVTTPSTLPKLDLNSPEEICDFICKHYDLG